MSLSFAERVRNVCVFSVFGGLVVVRLFFGGAGGGGGGGGCGGVELSAPLRCLQHALHLGGFVRKVTAEILDVVVAHVCCYSPLLLTIRRPLFAPTNDPTSVIRPY
eukprot:5619102-Pyramimonas_sp.AAC.1